MKVVLCNCTRFTLIRMIYLHVTVTWRSCVIPRPNTWRHPDYNQSEITHGHSGPAFCVTASNSHYISGKKTHYSQSRSHKNALILSVDLVRVTKHPEKIPDSPKLFNQTKAHCIHCGKYFANSLCVCKNTLLLKDKIKGVILYVDSLPIDSAWPIIGMLMINHSLIN